MTYTSVLAQSTVSDLGTAERWYTTLLGRGPDSRPMEGLLEWHVVAGGGVQVWAEPERAGGCTVLLSTDDLDGTAARLTASGLADGGPEDGGGARLLRLTDPDGNRVVVLGR
jgi:predicted enzyme related to lactoylglutathione lyase